MEDIGLNDNLAAGSRQFHVQTATLVEDGVIRSEVFEKGQVLFVENFHYERRNDGNDKGPEGRLRRVVDTFHQSIIEEIDCLFEMSDRIFSEDSISAHEKIGQVFLYMHIFDKAERHFKKTLEMDPDRHSCYVHLGRCYYRQKRYKQATDVLTDLLNRNAPFPDLHNLMGQIMLEKRSYRKALQSFKQALKLNPAYIEAYFNLSEAILSRITRLTGADRREDLRKSIEFLQIILKKIDHYGDADDRQTCAQIIKTLNSEGPKKALVLMHEYREDNFIRRIPPEIIGYRFSLRLLYSEEAMSTELLNTFEEKLSAALEKNPSYPDLWHYLGLIHLMQCRHFFLKGLDNFKDATQINPNFDKALKNLRLVENDGREFLSLIKTII